MVVQRLGVVGTCRHLMDRRHLRQLIELFVEGFLLDVSAVAEVRICRPLDRAVEADSRASAGNLIDRRWLFLYCSRGSFVIVFFVHQPSIFGLRLIEESFASGLAVFSLDHRFDC